MSTMTQPRISIDAPAPRPPAFGLTGSPAAATEVDDARWEAGAYIETYPESKPSAHDPCSTGSDREKDLPDEYVQPNPFPAFTAYLGQICTAYSIGNYDTWRARAEVALEARTSWALERQLAWAFYGVTSDDPGPQPFLADADADLPAGASAVPAANALAWAEAYGAELGQEFVIHLPPPVVSFLGMDYFRVVGSSLYTAAGTPVIVGPGYYGNTDDNLDPQASGAGEAAAGQSWIFASSKVLYRRGEMYALPETIGEATDRDDNTVIYRAERDLWVAFDGLRHAAILADWTP